MPTYTTRSRRRKTALHVPPTCVAAAGPGSIESPVICHRGLLCSRCARCLHHCLCASEQALPASQPRRKRREPREIDPRQGELCPRPDLRLSDSDWLAHRRRSAIGEPPERLIDDDEVPF